MSQVPGGTSHFPDGETVPSQDSVFSSAQWVCAYCGEIVLSHQTNVVPQSAATLGWGLGEVGAPVYTGGGCALCPWSLNYAKFSRLGLPRRLNQAWPGPLGALWLLAPRSHHISWSTCRLCCVPWTRGFS